MASTIAQVHPMVLLNVVDHITRFNLSHPRPAPPSSSSPETAQEFLCTAGVLMGTTSAAEADGAGAATALTSSFELPLMPNVDGGPTPLETPTGDAACLARVMAQSVDWTAARQHREQLAAVMPESAVVGCYAVCSGVRHTSNDNDGQLHAAGATSKKKPRNEAHSVLDAATTTNHAGDVDRIARCFAKELAAAGLLSSVSATAAAATADGPSAAADGFVLMLVYDGEVTLTGVRHRLPFEVYTVTAEAEETMALAVPVPAIVTPADMEWIGLASAVPNSNSSSGGATDATPTTPQGGKPGFLRRCSAALLSAAAPSSNPLSPKSAPPAQWEKATTAASAQSHNAAEGLVSSLGVLSYALDTAQSANDGARPTPEATEMVRAVATCVRNVPHIGTAAAPQQRADVLPVPPSADLLRAVLAMEAQCAMRVSAAQQQQRTLVQLRKSLMSSMVSTKRSGAASAVAASAKRTGGTRGRVFDVEEVDAGVGWHPSRREGHRPDPEVTIVKGHVW